MKDTFEAVQINDNYQSKPTKVRARQFTGWNFTEILVFMNEGFEDDPETEFNEKNVKCWAPPHAAEHDRELKDEDFGMLIPSPEGRVRMVRGSWLIKGSSKKLGVHHWVNDQDYFQSKYEKD